MTRKIIVEVREEFYVPLLFTSDQEAETSCALREMALTIGSYAVQESRSLSQVSATHQALEAALREQRELNSQISALHLSHDQELEKVREESRRHLACERLRLRESIDVEISAKAERAIDERVREAVLIERERQAAEREALTLRLEERHAKVESLNTVRLVETLKQLEQMRAEHEGLVVKLMARLEPVHASRGAISSSASLGRTFEENVERHLRQVFGARTGFHLEDVHAAGHSGDLMMIFDGLRILIELKCYDPRTRVPTKEVEKLARDLAEAQPPCDAAIMISACSDITGHYSCGPLEVSSTVACVPVLFINNFLSLGEPQVTLHMSRVFLSMVKARINQSDETQDFTEDRLKMANVECARRCTGYLSDLTRQSAELLRQVTVMKNGAVKLRETVLALVESEVARFNGIVQLMSHGIAEPEPQEVAQLDRTVFADPTSLTLSMRELAANLSIAYEIGDHRQQCPTKELLHFIQTMLNVKSEKIARDALKAIFLDSVVKHGYVIGVAKKTAEVQQID